MKKTCLSLALLLSATFTVVSAQNEVIHTTTTTTVHDDGDGVNMNVNMGGMGTGINIGVNTTGMGTGTSTSTTTTRTTTTTRSSSYGGYDDAPPPPPPPPPPARPRNTGYTGPVGCPYPIDDNDFNGIRQSIADNDFENTKYQVATQICDTRCFTAAQVRDLTRSFDFEATRLKFAKYAYPHTYDIGNYYLVNKAFDFDASIRDLDAYIRNGR